MATRLTHRPDELKPEQWVPPVRLVSHTLDSYFYRPEVRGKFIFIGEEKFWLKGVTYGTFAPDQDGVQFPAPDVVERDFVAMAKNGINTVRIYTPPPLWLLNTAQDLGLRVMVGLPWEQHVAFLDDRKLVAAIEDRVRTGIESCVRHPAVLCYAIGNEIPASIVRWQGRQRVERFLARLYRVAKAADPAGLVTYVNFPTTEYLQLPFLDLVCFNVYLEAQEDFSAYLARLHNLAGDRPLLMAETGLDSRRNGENAQAEILDWQMRTVFSAGCAGAFVFAWTDEWHRGGHAVEDWDFGLTSRERMPKPALTTVREVFAEAPFPPDVAWPKISVVVCSLNGAPTIRDTLDGLTALDYPDYEVIVIDDGSTDQTALIVGEYDVRLISTENRGLSNARNTGWQEARGEIVAYIDDDAYPDPHWLHYLAHTLMTTDYAGVGGPNIAPPGDGPIADCVANAPGGPVQVLLTDIEAEHIPGCNMAFRRAILESVGGFDPRYRAAGDDVDICWQIQASGEKIAFNPSAVDWHHRRNSVKMYWTQQQGYGKAEALLEEKWPEKYNAVGHLKWSGRLYGKGIAQSLRLGRSRIYQGQWGSAPFQSIYEPAEGTFSALPLMPEWYLIIAALALLTLLGISWQPLLWAGPLLALAIAAPVAQAVLSAAKAEFPTPRPSGTQRLQLRALTALLHLLQPLARLIGRLRHGLTPWRKQLATTRGWRWSHSSEQWSEVWRTPEGWLEDILARLQQQEILARPGGELDAWDLEVRGGLLGGGARLLMAIEEHGSGRQMLRFRSRATMPNFVVACVLSTGGLALMAASQGGWLAAGTLGCIFLAAALDGLWQSTASIAAINAALTSTVQAAQPELHEPVEDH
jgi:glycosyltransferase involved in cell wall biosynthesis